MSRADFGGIISLDISKRLKVQSKAEPGELSLPVYNRMPSNREGQLFVPKDPQESLLGSINGSRSPSPGKSNSQSSNGSDFDVFKSKSVVKMKPTYLNNSMIVEYKQNHNSGKNKH